MSAENTDQSQLENETKDSGGKQEPRSHVDEDGHDRIDRDSVDFDPDDGLLSGTAIKGGTKIPGPHEHVDDVMEDEDKVDDPTESSATF